MATDGRARERYLLKNYGLTIEDYAKMALLQGGACKCCGQIPTGRDLHIDHCHKIAGTKIKVAEYVKGFFRAFTVEYDQTFEGASREEVKQEMKRWLLKKSVRGLLCWKCNEGLRAFKNRSEVCRNAAKYLDDFLASL